MPAVAPRRPTPPAPPARVEAAPVPAVSATDGVFLWTRERYDRMVEAGVLTPDDKVELIEGQIVPQMSQNEPHAVVTGLVGDALRVVFASGAHIRDEKPIALSDLSEPEPDLAVVPGARRDYLDDHPKPDVILLLVEVADTSLMGDRLRKAPLYAEAMIVEYWIVNIQDCVLEVHRDPAGGTYRTKTTLAAGDTVSPVHAPDARIPVADLLP